MRLVLLGMRWTLRGPKNTCKEVTLLHLHLHGIRIWEKFPVCNDYLANLFRNAIVLYLTVTNLIRPALTYG